MGVLRWVEHSLTDLTFFEEAAESSSLFLVLLDEVLYLPYFDIKPSTSFCLLSPTSSSSLLPRLQSAISYSIALSWTSFRG